MPSPSEHPGAIPWIPQILDTLPGDLPGATPFMRRCCVDRLSIWVELESNLSRTRVELESC
eukprot:4019656-Pyramimonas_sp.AAC.1